MTFQNAVLAGLAAAMLVAAPVAVAQGNDRAQMMSRVIDGINSPDPVTRIVTLEEAMATKDRNLQRVALSAAFASSDQALRAAALEALFATKASFIVEFTDVAKEGGSRVYWDAAAGNLEVHVSNFDAATGKFEARTNYSYRPNNATARTAGPGTLSGDRLSFAVNLATLANNGSCSGNVVAEPGTAVLAGTMSCVYAGSLPGYKIKVDLLR